jgi:hypothetical protein
MRIISKGLIFSLAAVFFALNVSGIMPDPKPDHFQTIPQRNVFGLKEPEKMVITNPPRQQPKILLTGITTILGNKRALLKILPAALAGKAADASKEISLILTEGQREADVEVLQIDEKAGSVRVNNSGTVMTLTFERDGPKLSSTPATAGQGIPPGVPTNTGGIPIPGVVAPGLVTTPVVPNTNSGIRSFPSRTPRWPATANTPSTQQPATAPALPAAPPIPGTSAAALNSAPPVPADLTQGLSREEQAILQQFQKAAAQNQALPPASGSGMFQTPGHEGMAPAFGVPQPPLPANNRPVLPQ